MTRWRNEWARPSYYAKYTLRIKNLQGDAFFWDFYPFIRSVSHITLCSINSFHWHTILHIHIPFLCLPFFKKHFAFHSYSGLPVIFENQFVSLCQALQIPSSKPRPPRRHTKVLWCCYCCLHVYNKAYGTFNIHKDDRVGRIKQRINIHLFPLMSNPDDRS